MPYTSHGHWYGPGTPTLPAPQCRARCGGPSMCPICSKEAGPISRPKAEASAEAERIEYACRYTGWGTDPATPVIVYELAGEGDAALQQARAVVVSLRRWQAAQGLPVDAVVVSRPIPEWTAVDSPARP